MQSIGYMTADVKDQDLPGDLDQIAREGARRMLVTALEVEVQEYIESHRGDRDDDGRAMVVRNGKARPRKVTMGAGTVEVQAPRVNDKRVNEDGERERFTSKILPPYMRRSPKVSEVLPVLYLRGLSTGDFKPALMRLLGEDASGLSASAISKMLSIWEQEYDDFSSRDLSDRDYVYVWADGVHFNIRLDEDRLCTLVLVGVRLDGTKELIAIEDGYRESTESWKTVLRGLKKRGMRAPALAIGDGALGFWRAVRDIWPETKGQRCWVHKVANVLDKLPKRVQPKAKKALHEIMYAEDQEGARKAMKAFAKEYRPKFSKAVETLLKDEEQLLTLFSFPAEHWTHIRSTNPIESTFATVRLRQRVTKGAGSRRRGLVMAYKLMDMAQARWRRISAAHLIAQVRGGIAFEDGVRIERVDAKKGKGAA